LVLSLGVAVAGLGLAACGVVRPRPAPSASPPAQYASSGESQQTPDSPSRPEPPSEATASTKLPLTELPSGPIPTLSNVAALNSRILSQVSSPMSAEDLPLGPGDLIEVSVFEVEELSKLKIRVPLNGKIMFPLLGSLNAAGRTPVQIEDDIRTRLQQKYMHDPHVSVFVLEQKSHRISIIGAVRKGGVHTFTGPMRLADALAMAEGLTDEADHVIYLIRRVPTGTIARARAGEPVPARAGAPPPDAQAEEITVAIDLDALAGGKEDLNVPLQASDVIHVPRAGSFYVGGEVAKPGTFPLKSKTTLDQAILAAGGVRNIADWSDVRIYRTNTSGKQDILTFDLNELEKGKAGPEIQRNDVVLVGKSGAKTFAYGVIDFVKSIFNIGVGVSRGF
jgi:polysaccharide export outer membrane protein